MIKGIIIFIMWTLYLSWLLGIIIHDFIEEDKEIKKLEKRKMINNMKVINLFGTPGSGKSTGAAYIFSRLKMYGQNVELVTEFAKDKVYEENPEVFKNQLYIFGKQSFKMSRCKDKVDYIITDSPLLLSAFYNEDPVLGDIFNDMVERVFNSYENLNFFIERVKPYNPSGRFQTESESDQMAAPLKEMLDKYNVEYESIPGEVSGYDKIVDIVLSKWVKQNLKEELGK